MRSLGCAPCRGRCSAPFDARHRSRGKGRPGGARLCDGSAPAFYGKAVALHLCQPDDAQVRAGRCFKRTDVAKMAGGQRPLAGVFFAKVIVWAMCALGVMLLVAIALVLLSFVVRWLLTRTERRPGPTGQWTAALRGLSRFLERSHQVARFPHHAARPGSRFLLQPVPMGTALGPAESACRDALGVRHAPFRPLSRPRVTDRRHRRRIREGVLRRHSIPFTPGSVGARMAGIAQPKALAEKNMGAGCADGCFFPRLKQA